MPWPRLVWIACALAAAADAPAIVRRHDRPDAAYLERARAEQWRSAVSVGRLGIGTLVAPDWVLTAAHVSDALGPFSWLVVVNDREHVVRAVYRHPDYDGTRAGPDIALLHLEEPVRGVKPAELYFGTGEEGQAVVFVGNGLTGTGESGPDRTRPREWRMAENRVIRARGDELSFDFDAPPGGEEWEGISGPGDSGGPAYLLRDGTVFVIGVSSANLPGRGHGLCTYGTREVYARVSAHRAWLENVLAGKGTPDRRWVLPRLLAPGNWPGGARGARIEAWFATLARQDAVAFGQFLEGAAAPEFLARRPAAQRAQFAERIWREHGTVVPTAAAEAADGRLSILARSEKTGEWIDFTFSFNDPASARLTDIRPRSLGRREKFAGLSP